MCTATKWAKHIDLVDELVEEPRGRNLVASLSKLVRRISTTPRGAESQARTRQPDRSTPHDGQRYGHHPLRAPTTKSSARARPGAVRAAMRAASPLAHRPLARGQPRVIKGDDGMWRRLRLVRGSPSTTSVGIRQTSDGAHARAWARGSQPPPPCEPGATQFFFLDGLGMCAQSHLGRLSHETQFSSPCPSTTTDFKSNPTTPTDFPDLGPVVSLPFGILGILRFLAGRLTRFRDPHVIPTSSPPDLEKLIVGIR